MVSAPAKVKESSSAMAQAKARLQEQLDRIAKDNGVLRPEWDPLLDSERCVGVVAAIADLFPTVKIPPDKIVRKGGYQSVRDALNDMSGNLEKIVNKKK